MIKYLNKFYNNLDIHTAEVFIKSFKSLVIKGLGVIFTLFLSILLARTIGAEGIGVINLTNKIILLSITLGLFGSFKFIIKEVAISHNQKDFDEIGNVMHTAYWFNGCLTLIISVTLILLSPFISNHIFMIPELKFPLIIASIVLTPQVFSRIFSAGLAGYRKIWQSILVDSTLSIFFTLFFLLILWLNQIVFTINLVAICYALGRLCVTISVGIYWNKIFQNFSKRHKNFKKLLKTSKPLFIVSLVGIIINNGDVIILGLFSDANDVGIYSICLRISLLIVILLQITNSAVSPKIASLYSKNKLYDLELMIKKTTKFLFFIGLIFYLFLVLFGKSILSLWGDQFITGYIILLIVGFGQFVNISTGAVGAILVMTGFEKVQRKISLYFLFIFAVSCIILTSQFGIIGAAISTCLTKTCINLTKLIYVTKLLNIKIFN